MNKNLRIVQIIILVAVLAAAAWIVYMIFGPKLPLEAIVPPKPAVYVRVAHPAKHWQNLAASEFWKSLSSVDVPKVLARNNMSSERIAQFERSKKQVMAFLQSPLTKKFLGREIAAAIYLPPEIEVDPQHEYDLLVMLRLPLSVRAVKFVDEFFHQSTEEVDIRRDTYAGERIVHMHWKKKDLNLKYVLLQDLLLISSEDSKKFFESIDAYHRKKPSLKQDGNFIFVQSRAYSDADGLAYLNMRMFEDWGLKNSGLSFLTGGTIAKYKLILGLDEAKAKDFPLIACDTKDNPSLNFIPADVLGYQWNGCYDFQNTWQQARSRLHQAMPKVEDQADRLGRSMQRHMGVKLGEDLLPLLDNETGGYLTDIDTVGLFPYPRLLAFVKVKDREKTQEVIDKMVKNPLGLLQQEEYGKVNISYITIPLGGNMDPAYCFLDNYLLAATSRQLLKKSIDAYHDPLRSLKSDKTFSAFGLDSVNKSQSITFIKVGALAHVLHDLLDWGNKYLSSQVSTASAHKQEGEEKKKELATDLAAKQAELKLALKKLTELKARPVEGLPMDEQGVLIGAIQNLQREVEGIKEDIQNYSAQRLELEGLLANYETQVESAKLFMFNSQHVFVPILKGFETVNAQGVRVTASSKVIETELMLN